MANEISNTSSASISTVVLSDKSGRQTAHTLSKDSDASSQNVEQSTASRELMNKADKHQDAVDAEKRRQELEKQAQNLQSLSELKGWSVSFRVDNELDKTVIIVVDADTQKPIRQIPDEKLLALSKRIQELTNDNSSDGLAGLLLDSEI